MERIVRSGRMALGILVLLCLQAIWVRVPALGQDNTLFDGIDGLDVPYVPTPMDVVERMLDMAEVTPDDLVYDLGCGDGRIVITAARERGALGVGIDLDPQRIRECGQNARRAGVTGRVRFYRQDLFSADLSGATVVTLYLLPSVNLELRPKLFRELEPGTRIVSHDFDMGEWEADRTEEVNMSTVYFWVMPANASGTWEWTMPGEPGEARFVLHVDQEFQYAAATLDDGVAETPLEEVRISGDMLSFTAEQRIDGRTVHVHYQGRVSGSSIEGAIRVQDGSRQDVLAWQARRDPATVIPIDGQAEARR